MAKYQRSIQNQFMDDSKDGSSPIININKGKVDRHQQSRNLEKSLQSNKSNLSDFKHLLESSQIIDEIFHQRSITIEA